MRFGERSLRLRNVAQRRVEDRHVAGGVGEAGLTCIADLEAKLVGLRRELARALHQDGRRIDPKHVRRLGARGKHARHGTRPAAELDHAGSAGPLDVGQVAVEHRALIRVRGAHLEPLRDGPHDVGVGSRDVGVGV